MNTHLRKIIALFGAIGRQIKDWYWELPFLKKVVAILGPIAIIVIAWRILPTVEKIPEAEIATKQVELRNVGELSNMNAPLSLVGQVTSVNEAVIRAQASGQVRVYKKLGDYVSVGQVIGEFDNKSQKAAVLQAEGAYESAKAARDISAINSGSTNQNISDTKTNTLNTITAAFSTMDDIVRVKTDVAFTDPRGDSPRMKFLNSDSLLQGKVENERAQIEKLLQARTETNKSLTINSDLLSEIQRVQAEVQIVKTYLDDLNNLYVKSLANSDFPQGSLDAQKATIGISRTTISGTLTSLSASKVALQAGLTSVEISGSGTEVRSPTAASSDAQVKTALGAYNGALARLEDTIIRSPINGTLNSLSIKSGDFVNQTSQVAVVSNNGALEVVAYISSDDAERVSVNMPVKINEKLNGVVTRLAKAIDPVTKKIEVRIGIVDKNSELINGTSVKIEISGNPKTSVNQVASSQIKIPLSSVKITPRGSFVFTVSASGTLVSVPVTIGTLLGDNVEIVSGLTSDIQIVKDARGLKEGEVVAIKQ